MVTRYVSCCDMPPASVAAAGPRGWVRANHHHGHRGRRWCRSSISAQPKPNRSDHPVNSLRYRTGLCPCGSLPRPGHVRCLQRRFPPGTRNCHQRDRKSHLNLEDSESFGAVCKWKKSGGVLCSLSLSQSHSRVKKDGAMQRVRQTAPGRGGEAGHESSYEYSIHYELAQKMHRRLWARHVVMLVV